MQVRSDQEITFVNAMWRNVSFYMKLHNSVIKIHSRAAAAHISSFFKFSTKIFLWRNFHLKWKEREFLNNKNLLMSLLPAMYVVICRRGANLWIVIEIWWKLNDAWAILAVFSEELISFVMQLNDKRSATFRKEYCNKNNRAERVIKQTIKLINSVRDVHSWRPFTEILLLSVFVLIVRN